MIEAYIDSYKYRGAGALVVLHEDHLRVFLQTWKKAKSKAIVLPETDDSNYQSLETLLLHPLRSAKSYLDWICEMLELEDPKIREAPELVNIAQEADEFVNHLLERWRLPLVDVETKRFDEVYKTKWGMMLPIEAMLEHAVMHPIRHSFQLNNLMNRQGRRE